MKPHSSVTFAHSTDQPGQVVMQAYVDRVCVLSKSIHWRAANGIIPEIHAACVQAERLEREAGR